MGAGSAGGAGAGPALASAPAGASNVKATIAYNRSPRARRQDTLGS